MNGVAMNPNHDKFFYRLKHKWSEWLMWNPLLRKMWVSVGIRTGKYTEHPNFSRPLAGIHELFWMMACGYGFKFGLKMAMIYWRPK